MLVRVHAASVNARDWHVMRGEPRVARLMDRTLFGRRGPRVPVRGTDFAGVVEAVGTDVTARRPGDAVFGEGAGTFADYAIASADQVAAIPAGTTFEQAAALPLAATTALLCLDETGPRGGGRVLINGASGGVGTFAVQAAKATGLHVTAVVSTRNVDLVESLGADEVVDYTTTTSPAPAGPGTPWWTWSGTTDYGTCGPTVRAGGRLVLSGGGNSGEGRIVGPMKLLIGAMALARFQPFEVRVPQSVPTTEVLRAGGDDGGRRVDSGQWWTGSSRWRTPAAAIRHVEAEHARGKVVVTVE